MFNRKLQTETVQNASRDRRAFSLLEMVVATSILLLIAAFLTTALGRTIRSTRKTANQQAVNAIAAAVEQFRIENGFLPPLVHDGQLISSDNFYPIDPLAGSTSSEDGPLKDGQANISYEYSTLVVWSEGYDFEFFRRRAGDANDRVEIPSGGVWNIDTAWDDRRYSRYGLAYYLVGSLPRSVDGVAGQGMARPMVDGSFQGVGYPIGGTRGKVEPLLDLERRGVKLQTGYARAIDIAEHDLSAPLDGTVEDVYNLYEASELDQLASLVDDFGTAYRYYRWEHGRYDNNRRLVIENSLDLNIPPVLLDPEALIALQNDDSASDIPDLTAGDISLREARFAIVGAGADRLFGTEPIEYLAEQLRRPEPDTDEEVAQLRKLAMDDNVVAYGK